MSTEITEEQMGIATMRETNNLNRFRARKGQRERATRKGRTGGMHSASRASQSHPSGQPVSWLTVAQSVLALSGLFVLIGGLVALHVGKAVIRKGRGR